MPEGTRQSEEYPLFEIEQRIDELVGIMNDANQAIMNIYATDFDVEIKGDDSPLTLADKASNDIMVPRLEAFFGLPVISEEDSTDKSQETQRVLQAEHAYIVVDPLDGTREFVAKTGQFCPGFALIVDSKPYFGMYSVPTQGLCYYGGPSIGSYKKIGDNAPERIYVAQEPTNTVLASRIDKGGPTADYVHEHYKNYAITSVGSMMKFGMLAEGKADAYPCIDRPLKLWDLAPGHAIVEGAGGIVTRPDGSEINYRNASLLAGDFVARAF